MQVDELVDDILDRLESVRRDVICLSMLADEAEYEELLFELDDWVKGKFYELDCQSTLDDFRGEDSG